jgi:centractin
MDLRKALYGNIVLSGGSTLTKGFGNRLLHEVQRLAVKDMRIKILAPPERIYTTWTGGSILAGLSTFKKVSFALHHHVRWQKSDTCAQMWVEKDEWQENPDIIHTKFA